MEYYFNELEPVEFQRLIFGILVARYGEETTLTPLRGADGGRDGETSPASEYYEFQVAPADPRPSDVFMPPRAGRYLFQVKHHKTTDVRPSDARNAVVDDFRSEIEANVLTRTGPERVNYFFLITNVPSSAAGIEKTQKIQLSIQNSNPRLFVAVWWKEEVSSRLDQMPALWTAHPKIFAGGQVPFLGRLAAEETGLPRALYLALRKQYERERLIKFRQIELERELSRLFVDLDVSIEHLPATDRERLLETERRFRRPSRRNEDAVASYRYERSELGRACVSARRILLHESKSAHEDVDLRKLLVEGGPGQGKSTVTQMVAQFYREQIFATRSSHGLTVWPIPSVARVPFRVELSRFADFLSKNPSSSIEQFIVQMLTQDSGGASVTVEQFHDVAKTEKLLVILDGLDEIGSDELRIDVLEAVSDCVARLEKGLQCDLRVIITTRPPAIAGRRGQIPDFKRLVIAPLSDERTFAYLERWLVAQVKEEEEKSRIRQSFLGRQKEPHVAALSRNPMQLSVLLHFIRLKGEAFPDRRAELYRDYFQIVIDRDVEKSPKLREQRQVIESLHQLLGYTIHSLTEAKESDGTLERDSLLSVVQTWLEENGHESQSAHALFRLGEERLGLLATLKGEGEDARYGFEIQPVREYFAAAYINDQIEINAHEVFEDMVRRPFWREVALFLAGLRRPNEKADLVARLRSIDQGQNAWRQVGRSLALHLLAEGALTHPQHVFSDALDYLMDLLDTEKVPAQSQPRTFLGQLPALLQRGVTRHRDRLARLLVDNEHCQDTAILDRLYGVAQQTMTPAAFSDAIWSHNAESPELLTLMRLVWPAFWEVRLEPLVQREDFWKGASVVEWADAWLKAWRLAPELLTSRAPSNFHKRLFERLAVSSTPTMFFGIGERTGSGSNWAVWQLLHRQSCLAEFSRYGVRPESATIEAIKKTMRDDELSFVGLDQNMADCARVLLKASAAVIDCVLTEADPSYAIQATGSLTEYLRTPGAIGWVTYRTGVALLTAMLPRGPGFRARRHEIPAALARLVDTHPNLTPFVVELRHLFDGYHHPDDSALGADFFAFYEAASQPFPFLADRPAYFRAADGHATPTIDLYVARALGNRATEAWLRDLPCSTTIIRPLVEVFREDLATLLETLGTWQFEYIGPGAPLRTSDMNRILSAARKTDDRRTLRGAAIALSTSRFIKSAGDTLLSRLVKEEPALSDVLFEPETRPEHVEVGAQENEVLLRVAHTIVESPTQFAFGVVQDAALFLSENDTVSLSPLRDQRPELRIGG